MLDVISAFADIITINNFIRKENTQMEHIIMYLATLVNMATTDWKHLAGQGFGTPDR